MGFGHSKFLKNAEKAEGRPRPARTRECSSIDVRPLLRGRKPNLSIAFSHSDCPGGDRARCRAVHVSGPKHPSNSTEKGPISPSGFCTQDRDRTFYTLHAEAWRARVAAFRSPWTRLTEHTVPVAGRFVEGPVAEGEQQQNLRSARDIVSVSAASHPEVLAQTSVIDQLQRSGITYEFLRCFTLAPALKLPTRLCRGTTKSDPTCHMPPRLPLHLPGPRRTWQMFEESRNLTWTRSSRAAAGCHRSARKSQHAETGGRFDDSHRLTSPCTGAFCSTTFRDVSRERHRGIGHHVDVQTWNDRSR